VKVIRRDDVVKVEILELVTGGTLKVGTLSEVQVQAEVRKRKLQQDEIVAEEEEISEALPRRLIESRTCLPSLRRVEEGKGPRKLNRAILVVEAGVDRVEENESRFLFPRPPYPLLLRTHHRHLPLL
jgi:hypothetical protein